MLATGSSAARGFSERDLRARRRRKRRRSGGRRGRGGFRHVPALEASHVTEHLSKNGNYLSISYAIRAESREQMTALAADLPACEGVLLVI